jgi:hypothetical protein
MPWLPMHFGPRCGAHSRRTGQPCRNGAMPNGRCRMHGGATPRGAQHGAFVHGEHTIEAIGERRKAAALHEEATALLVDAIRAQTDVALKLRRGLLRPGDAEAQRELRRVQIAAALAMRERATELRNAWMRRRLITKRKPWVKPPAGPSRDE